MFRLEPGDEMRARIGFDLAKAEEGVHFVDVAADRAGEPFEPMNDRIGLVLQRVRPLPQLHQHRVEQSEALRILMADHLLRELDEGTRDAEQAGRRGRRRGGRAEQIGLLAGDFPEHLGGRGPDQSQSARRLSPAVEIVGRGEADGADRPPVNRARCHDHTPFGPFRRSTDERDSRFPVRRSSQI